MAKPAAGVFVADATKLQLPNPLFFVPFIPLPISGPFDDCFVEFRFPTVGTGILPHDTFDGDDGEGPARGTLKRKPLQGRWFRNALLQNYVHLVGADVELPEDIETKGRALHEADVSFVYRGALEAGPPQPADVLAIRTQEVTAHELAHQWELGFLSLEGVVDDLIEDPETGEVLRDRHFQNWLRGPTACLMNSGRNILSDGVAEFFDFEIDFVRGAIDNLRKD